MMSHGKTTFPPSSKQSVYGGTFPLACLASPRYSCVPISSINMLPWAKSTRESVTMFLSASSLHDA